MHDTITRPFQYFMCTNSLCYNITWICRQSNFWIMEYFISIHGGGALMLHSEFEKPKKPRFLFSSCLMIERWNIKWKEKTPTEPKQTQWIIILLIWIDWKEIQKENKRNMGHWNICTIHWITKSMRKSIHELNAEVLSNEETLVE